MRTDVFVVFGATGKVGNAAAAELLRRRMPVRAVSRDLMRGRMRAPVGCEIVTGDLRDRIDVRVAIEGAAGVLIVCPLDVAAESPMSEARRIADAVTAALDAVRPKTVVVISDYGAQHRSGTGIPVLFHLLESRLRAIPTPITFLRSAEHMENWARYALVARRTGVLPSMHHPLTKLFPFVAAEDVGIEAASLLAERGARGSGRTPHVVHIEGPCRYSVLDVAATLGALLSRPVSAVEVPRDAWHAQLVAAGLGDGYARLVAELGDARAAGRIDVESASDLRRGRTTLSEALAAAIARNAGSGKDVTTGPFSNDGGPE